MQTSILVVEDENIVAKDIVDRLRHLGYRVCGTASTGADAVELTRRERPALVLMDIMLKGPMDGIEAAGIITSQCDTPVIYLTAYADESSLQRAKQTEAFGYLLKPFEERELHVTIEMALFKHQMESKVRESEEWLSAVLRSIGDAVIATDTAGTIRFMNSVAEHLTGWTRQEAAARPLGEVFRTIDEKTREPIPNPVSTAVQGETPRRLVMRTLLVARDGREVPVDDSAAPIRNAAGEITGAVVVFRDVTERRHAEEALRRSQSQLAGIVGSAMDAIVTVDADQHILLFNAAAEKMFACSAKKAVGQTLDQFLPERFRTAHRQHVESFSRTAVTRRSMGHLGLIYGLRGNGEEFPIEASISQIEVGEHKLFTVILRDVSDRNRMEDQLRQAQKMESIGRLAGGVAHDFSNVLAVILESVDASNRPVPPGTASTGFGGGFANRIAGERRRAVHEIDHHALDFRLGQRALVDADVVYLSVEEPAPRRQRAGVLFASEANINGGIVDGIAAVLVGRAAELAIDVKRRQIAVDRHGDVRPNVERNGTAGEHAGVVAGPEQVRGSGVAFDHERISVLPFALRQNGVVVVADGHLYPRGDRGLTGRVAGDNSAFADARVEANRVSRATDLVGQRAARNRAHR